MYKKICELLCALLIIGFFLTVITAQIVTESQVKPLDVSTIISDAYREQYIGEDMLKKIKKSSKAGKDVGLYLLESDNGYDNEGLKYSDEAFEKLEKNWKKQAGYETYMDITASIWDDVKYFPVASSTSDKEMTVSFVDTWMSERTYGGQRGHEGTDLMASKNERGIYPIVSMTNGTVTKKGWLEKGGYRIGITTEKGVYFYYAHLDSYANIEVGDKVKAGDLLGFMGDSGYGPEGTVGQFAVHLHLGIYIYPSGEEMSINPYWILRYIENKTVKCYTEE